jgi:adhesin transport system outer membrane protein
MVGLQYTPGAGFSSLAEARSATAAFESAQHVNEVARRDVLDAIQADWEQLRDVRQRLAILQEGLEGSKAVLASYERQFVAGRRTWLDVLNAAREFHQTESTLSDLRASQVAIDYRLKLRLNELPWQHGE